MAETMSPRFEPMTIGMILDTVVRLYLQNAALVIVLTIVAYLPYVICSSVVSLYVLFTPPPSQHPLLFASLSLLVAGLWLLVAYPLTLGATTYAISERYLQRPTSARRALQVAWQRYGTLVGAQTTVMVILMVGFLLLVIPGILWTLSYMLVLPAVMLESGRASDSRQRSWQLVAGHRLKVFVVTLVVGVLIAIINGVVGWVLPLFLDPGFVFGLVTTQILEQLVSYVVFPLFTITNVLLYYDLRIRKEGFDLEMLSLALSQT